MITEAGLIKTVYGIGCVGMGCGGLGQDYDATDTGSDLMPLDSSGGYTNVITDPVAVNADLAQMNQDVMNGLNNSSGMNLNTTNATTAPTTGSPTAAVNAIASAFTSIFKAIQPLPAGCTQIQNVYGTSTQCNASGTASTLSLSSSLGGISITTILLLAGGVLLFMNMSKKG